MGRSDGPPPRPLHSIAGLVAAGPGTLMDGADRFVQSVAGQSLWRSIDLRILAVRIGRRWTNLLTRGYLDHRSPAALERLRTVERSNVKAWQVVLPVREVAEVIGGIASGLLRCRPRQVTYVSRSAGFAHDLAYRFNDVAIPNQAAAYPKWSAHTLIGYGDSMFQLITRAGIDPLDLDNVIRAGPVAFKGLADLALHFHDRPGSIHAHDTSSIVELVAPIAIRFDKVPQPLGLNSQAVGLRARARVFAKAGRLNWTVIGASRTPRHGSVELKDAAWKRSGGSSITAEVQVPLESSDRSANLFIEVGDRCVDQLSIPVGGALRNPRIAAHCAVDPDLDLLRRGFSPRKRKEKKGFEPAVGALFHFLGFHVDPLSADPQLSEAVDHIAHDPASNYVLCIECTTDSLNGGGKLGKLLVRTGAIGSAAPGRVTIPVIVTAAPRETLSPTEVRQAEEDGIVVVAREDLDELLESAEIGTSTAETIARFQQQLLDARVKRHRAKR